MICAYFLDTERLDSQQVRRLDDAMSSDRCSGVLSRDIILSGQQVVAEMLPK